MTTRMKTFVLGLVLALSVCLVAATSHDTNAYLTDAQSGTLTGTLASGCNPYRLCLGTAEAKHWDGSACGSYRYQLISQCDKTSALSLDFGDALCGQQTAWPDVFRLVSLVSDPRKVSFTTSGPIAAFVTAVRLDCGASSTLAGHATAKVYVAVSVPSCARPGEYTGTLVIHVAGSPKDTQVPMVMCVLSNRRTRKAAPPGRQPSPRPSAISTVTPLPSATPRPATPAPSPSVSPSTPAPGPTATPTPTPSPSQSGASNE